MHLGDQSLMLRGFISVLTLAALALLFAAAPRAFADGPADEEAKEAPVWSADMLVVEYTSVSIGASSADLFSNEGGSAGLQVKSLWSFTPDRDLRLEFQEAVPGAADLTLQVGDLALAFPAGSSGQSSFRWTDVNVDWEDGQTISVRIVPTSAVAARPNSPATGQPTISGTAQVGETLTADTSGIADTDGLTNATFTYQWSADDANMQDATNSTYTLADSDEGKAIQVQVFFTDDAGNEEALTSEATTAVAAKPNSPATGQPTISGTAQVDETLTADITGIADEDGLDDATFTYQWLADDANIDGATDSRYILANSDEGKAIKVRVSFTDDADNQETLTSAATAAVAAKPNSLATGAPTISGVAQVGETLTADTSDIADSDGLDNASFSYQWVRNDGTDDADMQGATASTYTPSDEDVGKTIKVKVSFTDDADNEESLTSGATAVVAAKANNPPTGQPTISGTAQVGETLTADTSSIADADGLTNVSYSYRFQWARSSYGRGFSDIGGATDSTYRLGTADLGSTMNVRVSFNDDKGNRESLTSHGTVKVAITACPVGEHKPAATAVEVEAVPIFVESTAEEYFVLYARADLDSGREFPVSVTLGRDGTTTLTEQLSALPREHYRVEKYLIADPADIDDDCIDDITELGDPVGMNPLNPARAVPPIDGAVAIPDRETFEALSYKDTSLTSLSNITDAEFVKFYIIEPSSSRPTVYFTNTNTHRMHRYFWWAIGGHGSPDDAALLRGEIVFHPNAVAPDGSLGVYRFYYKSWDGYRFDQISMMNEVLAASIPLLKNNLAYHPRTVSMEQAYRQEQALFNASRVNILLAEDIPPDVPFVAFNPGGNYGFLRLMLPDESPTPQDVVIYETLPNELPPVAGIITTVPQTPLSHVNLRAVQDGVPNAFIRDALDDGDIDDLIGRYVHYSVTEEGYSIRAASPAEVEAHYAASRPTAEQVPERDLTITQITALDEIEFDDWTAFGVKAANVAVLRTLGFPDGTVPDGFAVPFYFYDEFMKHNGFYDDIEAMLADPEFQSDPETQESELKKLRKKIKKGETPRWIIDALTEMHATYPGGQSLRYRSSTNNEDLPGFSGAGLYDSKTQHPDETVEDGISKSLKQVYASLWNFRAFTERESHGVDHLATAMGVLVHPNYSDELANGVAVSFDPNHHTYGSYYVNTQLGEDLVTNPEAHSVPEEILLHRDGTHSVLATSNQVTTGQLLMSDAQMDQLRSSLRVIHEKFEDLYAVESSEPFAIEIEFKITSDNILAIKQARPWVFGENASRPNTPATGAPTISGTAQSGATLTANTSGIADEDGLDNATFTYQWLADDANIDGATDSRYTLTSSDEGKAIKVKVSFTDDAGNEETLTSAATAAVAPQSDNTVTDKEAPVWSADMLVVEYTSVSIGASSADLFSNEGGSAGLQVKSLWSFTPDRDLRLEFQEAVPGAADLTLQVGDLALAFPAGSSGQSSFRWTDVNVDWEDGQTISVRIVPTSAVAARPNSPATGQPTIGPDGLDHQRDGPGGRDADGGHVGHCRHRRADKRHIHLPVVG